MENSQPLATESFSYSWLTHRQPKLREDSDEDEQNFHFDVPGTSSPTHRDLVPADEIFSGGRIRPVYAGTSTPKTSSSSFPTTPISLYPSRSSHAAEKSHCRNLRKWRESSKRILGRCFRFVKPLCRTIGRSRTSSRVDDLERKVFEVRRWGSPLEASPRTSCSAYSVVEWSDFDKFDGPENFKNWRSTSINISPSPSANGLWDAENSIHEAILYCKRSIEK